MSDSAFLTTDLSQDTTEPIIPLLFSFLLVELKLILMGMTAEVMYSKSWTDQPSLQTVQWSSLRQCTEEHTCEWRGCPSQRQIGAACRPLWRTKMYMPRKTLKVCRVFFFPSFWELNKISNSNHKFEKIYPFLIFLEQSWWLEWYMTQHTLWPAFISEEWQFNNPSRQHEMPKPLTLQWDHTARKRDQLLRLKKSP